MKSLIFVSLAVLCNGLAIDVDPYDHKKVVCFWNFTSFERQGASKFQIEGLLSAMTYCTHLVYGYAGINATNYEVIPLHPKLDTGIRYVSYTVVTLFKKVFPTLKVYLSIGGNADTYEGTHKYLTMLESHGARTKFIDSIYRLLSDYNFDGIDLAWQFPPVQVKKNYGNFHFIWHDIKRILKNRKCKDKHEIVHREGFIRLVRNLKTRLRSRNMDVTITVLPHIHASVYYDPRFLIRNIDAVHLMPDIDWPLNYQKSPKRNPKKADYPAPTYESYGSVDQDNINASVRYWLEHGTPGGKIVVGIPTFARTWKLIKERQKSGVPPIVTNGSGTVGPYTQIPGFLSYSEVCARLTKGAIKIGDPSKKYGSYAYQSYNPDTVEDGIWISCEDPDTAANKATYAKAKRLGGIAIFDLLTDDFRGICTGDKFPIVRAVKNRI